MQRTVVAALAGMLAVASFSARTQTLEFDGVCALPPCASGSLYSAFGVTIAPGSLPVVASGTGMVTGTNGGRYLAVNAFPYQATITLARTARFVSVDVSRAGGSTAGQTFTLQALNNGVPVGSPETVTLGAINEWSTVAVSLPGGFNGFFLDSGAGGANLTFAVDNVRIGGNCSGFSDVLPGDVFCNATEWLYNRGVTLGCVLGQFCPAQSVTRAQMALFMQRLGTALTPVVLFDFDFAGNLDPSSGGVATLCTVFYTPSQPNSASAVGTLITYRPPGPGLYLQYIHYSTDGGATWNTPPGGSNSFATVASTTDVVSQTLVTPAFGLQPGRNYVFAARVSRQSGTAGQADFYCYLQVTVTNANPSTPLFDTPAAAPAPSR